MSDLICADRSYTVKTSLDLTNGSWVPFSGASDNGNQRTIADTAATGAKKFHTAEIVKPSGGSVCHCNEPIARAA